jgi:hypothetical protein
MISYLLEVKCYPSAYQNNQECHQYYFMHYQYNRKMGTILKIYDPVGLTMESVGYETYLPSVKIMIPLKILHPTESFSSEANVKGKFVTVFRIHFRVRTEKLIRK